MFIVLLFMFAGIVTGYLLRKWKFTFVNRVILTLIWLLLFLLGVEVGVNENVVRNFANLGFEAMLIAVFATLQERGCCGEQPLNPLKGTFEKVMNLKIKKNI